MTEMHQGVIAHLVVDGAIAALDFYKQALGATENLRTPAEDPKRLMHAEIVVNGSKIFVMDDFPEYRGGKAASPKALGGTPVTLHLEVADCDAAIARMAAAGGKVTMPPMDAFWGARYGQVVDPFGHTWSFAHPLPAKQT